MRRRAVGWYGRGQYMQGRGGYIGRIAGGLLGGLAGTAAAGAAIFGTEGALAGTAPSVIKGGVLLGSAIGDEMEDGIRSFVKSRALYSSDFTLTDSL